MARTTTRFAGISGNDDPADQHVISGADAAREWTVAKRVTGNLSARNVSASEPNDIIGAAAGESSACSSAMDMML